MSDLMEVFSRGDRFGTYTADGRVLVWVVVADGHVVLQTQPTGEWWPNHDETRDVDA